MSGADQRKGTPVATASAVVAPRKTVRFDGREYAPGAEVVLPLGEIRRLRGLGFLVDPNVKPIPVGNGPVFGSTEGPNIKALA